MRSGPPDSWYDPPEPPDLIECENCGEEVYPGSTCPACDQRAPTEAELRDEYESSRADDLRDAALERAEMEDEDY